MSGRCGRAALVTAVLVLLLAGCGDASSPGDRVPRLPETLARVDDAIAEHRYQRARTHLDRLVEATVAARDSGDLEPAEADRVLAAAARLLFLLPKPRPVAEPDGDSDEDEDEDGEHGKKQEELQKKLEEELKKLEERKKDEEGGNGPDDGEGN